MNFQMKHYETYMDVRKAFKKVAQKDDDDLRTTNIKTTYKKLRLAAYSEMKSVTASASVEIDDMSEHSGEEDDPLLGPGIGKVA